MSGEKNNVRGVRHSRKSACGDAGGRSKRITLLLGLAVLLSCGRDKSTRLATANDLQVTVDEFRFRRSFSPYLFRGKTIAEKNLEFTSSLLAEKWLAQEARSRGLAKHARYQAQMEQLHREFLFEAMYAGDIATRSDPDRAMGELLRTVMADKTMHISQAVFASLEQALAAVLEQKPFLKDSTRTLSEQEANRFRKTFAELQSRSLVRFANGDEWTVADFLLRLSVGPYPLPSPQSSDFRSALKHSIKKAAELEYLNRAAHQRGYSRNADVRLQEEMWSAALLSQSLIQHQNEQITTNEDEIKRYYRSHISEYTIKKKRMPLDSVRASIASLLRKQKALQWQQQLLQAMQAVAWYNHDVLDTLQPAPSVDLVVKRHFPGRMLVPVLLPFAEFIHAPADSTPKPASKP
ncbi:hypothetical protein GX408_16325 [bacterium]|nr:hypothetical protein [bacterium]